MEIDEHAALEKAKEEAETRARIMGTPAKEVQICPGCGKGVSASVRYPSYLCSDCESKLTDEHGALLTFEAIDMSGGYGARYQETGEEYAGHECYLDDKKYWADQVHGAGYSAIIARPFELVSEEERTR